MSLLWIEAEECRFDCVLVKPTHGRKRWHFCAKLQARAGDPRAKSLILLFQPSGPPCRQKFLYERGRKRIYAIMRFKI
jgi:hypothetical protein